MRRCVWMMCVAAAAWACDDGGGSGTMTDADPTPDAGVDMGADAGTELGPMGACDPLDEAACTLPWPSSRYLQPDAERATGYTLRFDAEALPASFDGRRIKPDAYARMDGYSPGSQILVVFPKLDVSPLAPETDVAASLDPDAPLVIYEWSATPRRVPYFVELDAFEMDPTKRLLYVRPAEVLNEDTRYVVAFRGLTDTDGAAIAPSPAFAALRDGATDGDADLAPRQARFDEIFAFLQDQDIPRESLTLAWDFHTASSDAMHGPMLHIRDRGFELAGPDGPTLVFDEVEEYLPEDDGSGAPVHPYTWLRIHGHFDAPHFMKADTPVDGIEGFIFNDGDAPWRPEANGTRRAGFWMIVPHVAKEGGAQGLVTYGHGLFGDGEEVLYPDWTRPCGRFPDRECGWWNARIGQRHGLIFAGADLVGMSEADVDAAGLTIVTEISLFTWIADRLHQGMLEYLLLTRALQRQLQTHPLFAERGIAVDPARAWYQGNSQGGIFGAAVVALSPDITRAHLGVPGQNYSLYLQRSTGFGPFYGVVQSIYPNTADQGIIINLLQLLWDGTENSSYLRHLSAEPFGDQAPSYILAAPTKGDYLVPPLAFEAVARTAALQIPALEKYDPERALPLAPKATYPRSGSGVVLWGLGNPWPESERANRPPPEHPLGDPHEDLRHLDAHADQMVHFLETGEIIDTCMTPTGCHFDADKPPPQPEE